MVNFKKNLLSLLFTLALTIIAEMSATVIIFTSLHDFHRNSGPIIYHKEPVQAPEPVAQPAFGGGTFVGTRGKSSLHLYFSFAQDGALLILKTLYPESFEDENKMAIETEDKLIIDGLEYPPAPYFSRKIWE